MINEKKHCNKEMKKAPPILLIDSNEIDNFINQKILENSGATNVLIFNQAISALQYLQQATDAPQLILLDIHLPVVDGFEFLDRFSQLEIAKLPIDIFILSASISPEDKQTAMQKNCAGFIEKPLTKEKLLTTKLYPANSAE